jgi:hypothetical protein
MKRHWIGALLALALAPALAAEEPATKADKPKLVCTKERSTGSHLPKRVCMTQAQHEERRKRDQEAMERMRSAPRPNDVSG